MKSEARSGGANGGPVRLLLTRLNLPVGYVFLTPSDCTAGRARRSTSPSGRAAPTTELQPHSSTRSGVGNSFRGARGRPARLRPETQHEPSLSAPRRCAKARWVRVRCRSSTCSGVPDGCGARPFGPLTARQNRARTGEGLMDNRLARSSVHAARREPYDVLASANKLAATAPSSRPIIGEQDGAVGSRRVKPSLSTGTL